MNRNTRSNRRILYVVTTPITAKRFLRGQLYALHNSGWETHLITSNDPDMEAFASREHTTFHALPFTRTPSLWRDLVTFTRLLTKIASLNPHTIVCGTPKASLTGLIAACILRVPRRIYVVHGLRYQGLTGLSRRALVAIERLIAFASTNIVPVSQSVMDELSLHKIAGKRPMTLLAYGSANGVDTESFQRPTTSTRTCARLHLDIAEDELITLFVGRLTRDKGIADLRNLANSLKEGQTLLIVGPSEPADAADYDTIRYLQRHPRVRWVGHLEDPRIAYAASDLLVLPTRREGLATVILEASACELPTVAYAVTGTTDVIADGRTGALVQYPDTESFVATVHGYFENPDVRRQHGQNARHQILSQFKQELVWDQWDQFLQAAPDKSS